MEREGASQHFSLYHELALRIKARSPPQRPGTQGIWVRRTLRKLRQRRRRRNSHVIRVVYEYQGSLPVVITVYNPLAKRYFEGRGRHEDRILT